jgi:hypothetical protein
VGTLTGAAGGHKIINPPGHGREGFFSIRGKKAAFQKTDWNLVVIQELE